MLVGDEDVSLRVFELVAEALDCSIECVSDASVLELVTTDQEILRGTPVFSGTRVPISNVLHSLATGISFERLRESYPFLTTTHIRAARLYVQDHPPEEPHRLVETLVGAVQRRLRTIDADDRDAKSWDGFYQGDPRVSDDFMPERSGCSGVRESG